MRRNRGPEAPYARIPAHHGGFLRSPAGGAIHRTLSMMLFRGQPPTAVGSLPCMRRVTTCAVSALVCGVLAACVEAGPRVDGAPRTSTAPSPTVASADEPPPPSAGELVLGPDGVGPLRMGMTHREVRRAGVGSVERGARHDGWPPGCRILRYDPESLGRTPGDTIGAVISEEHGLEQIYATARMVTPEGIRMGSTIPQVRVAFDRPRLVSGGLIVVRASPGVVYRVQVGGVVVSLSLQVRRPRCVP